MPLASKELHSECDVKQAHGDMARWADQVIKESPRPTMFILPMQGALIVGASVLRLINGPATYCAVKLSLYDASNQAGERANFDYWPVTEEDLFTYNYIVIDDVAESLRTYQAIQERLMARGAAVKLLVLIDKPVPHRVKGLRPDYAPLTAEPGDWLVGEGMNDGTSIEGLQCRLEKGVWTKVNLT